MSASINFRDYDDVVARGDLDERASLLRRKRAVESPLEPDRRRRLAAETPTQTELANAPRPDLDVVRQRAEVDRHSRRGAGASLSALNASQFVRAPGSTCPLSDKSGFPN